MTTISSTPPTNLQNLLVSQGEKLTDTSEKAIKAFKENQERQKKTIEALTKANADLEAKLLQKEAEFAEFKAASSAKINALESKLSAERIGLRQFIEISERELGPVLIHLKKRSPTNPSDYSICSEWMRDRYIESAHAYNKMMEVLTAHGTVIEKQIDLLKVRANSN